MSVDALVAAAAEQAGVVPDPAASASSEIVESRGGFDESTSSQPQEPSPAGPRLVEAQPTTHTEVPMLGAPDRTLQEAPPVSAQEDEAQFVPLKTFLMERDGRKDLRRQLEELQAREAELTRWRQEYEPVLDEARRIWPEMQQQAAQVPVLAQQLDQTKRLNEFYRRHLESAKAEYGLTVDEEGFLKDLQLQAALDRMNNIDQTINAALSHQFSQREAMYAAHQHRQQGEESQRRERADHDQRFEQQFGDLTKAAPGLKNFRNALRAEFDANPRLPLRDTAAPLVQQLSARQAQAASQAANMVRTQGPTSGARPQAGAPSPSERYARKGVQELIAQRRAELRGAGLL
jgi:hypothetical protein